MYQISCFHKKSEHNFHISSGLSGYISYLPKLTCISDNYCFCFPSSKVSVTALIDSSWVCKRFFMLSQNPCNFKGTFIGMLLGSEWLCQDSGETIILGSSHRLRTYEPNRFFWTPCGKYDHIRICALWNSQSMYLGFEHAMSQFSHSLDSSVSASSRLATCVFLSIFIHKPIRGTALNWWFDWLISVKGMTSNAHDLSVHLLWHTPTTVMTRKVAQAKQKVGLP